MARKVLFETGYSFVPASKHVILPRYVSRERLILITNVTANKVIYNFSDPSLLASSFTSYSDNQLIAYATGITAGGTSIVVTAANTFSTGQTVSIAAALPAAFNITGVITASSPTQFTVASTVTLGTTWISGGTCTVNANTVIALQYNTTTMLSTDKLQITIDEYAEKFTPDQTLLDPTNKLRVSNPQALIDTDFEYGTQVSKWENLAMVNNRPSMYPSATAIPGVSIMGLPNGSKTVTVTTSSAHGRSVGNPIIVGDAFLGIANGTFLIESVPTSTTFTYTANAINTTSLTDVFDANKTNIFLGLRFTNAQIGGAPVVSANFATNALTIRTTIPHGLAIGNEVQITGITGASGTQPNGSIAVATILSPTVFVVYPPQAMTGGTLVATSAAIFVSPQSNFSHRAFDGGVLFSSNGKSNYEQCIRQTRRYFRYQSGKGLQISSGTILKPYAGLDSITSSGTVAVVQSKEAHNIQPGVTIVVTGAAEAVYNGTFVVSNVLSWNQFTYALPNSYTGTASGNYTLSVVSWTGSSNRLGIFDQQNGLFFDYDGQTLSAVRRSSTYQISGKVTAVNGSTDLYETSSTFPTYFSKQLVVGDFIVLRGQSYRVTDIKSDKNLVISPAYRGASSFNVIASRTVDVKIPQSQWNLDKMDGTGPSGYNLDLSKMQMFYIDYTWYGAGFVRWGFRGPSGDVIYAHRMPNNNVNTEAYMRSGNLPGRYESSTLPPITQTIAAIATGDNAINVSSTEGFPSSGTLSVRGNTTTSISITGITASGGVVTYATASTTGLSDGQTVSIIGATAQQFNGIYTVASVSSNTNFTVASTSTGSTSAATASVITTEFVNYGSKSSTQFLSVTRGQPGATSITLTVASGSNSAFCPNTAGVQIGQRVISAGVPEGTFVSNISGNTVTLSQAVSTTDPTVTFAPMGVSTQSNAVVATTGQAFTYSTTSPTSVEFAYPTFAPGISHWGTSVIMDGRFDDDKSLVFTYGQKVFSTISAGASKALFSIRVAPSADNGIAAVFGARELINRMQLKLDALDISTKTSGANFLVQAILNGVPSAATTWTNAVANATGVANSSLAQIADHGTGATTVAGGEVTAGFFVNSVGSSSLSNVRDLGNSILGGGGTAANAGIYPDGPDTLTIVVTNLGALSADVLGRLSWTEAQA
jgi:hypothetical protein